LGLLLLALAVATCLHQALRPEKAGDILARNVSLAAQVSPFALLVGSFVVDASSLDLVARYGGADLPLLYRVSAVWGGRAGPLLLWAALLGVVTWMMAEKDKPARLEVRIMHILVASILLLSWLLDPFADAGPQQGELHPLLQTDLMVIHPPIVFAYYSLCLAAASVAIAGVLRRDSSESIHESQLHWARAAFLVGTIGIGLGGLWAYTVLDWGGYWAWDPVETGSLLPWLALLLVIHVRAQSGSKAVAASPAVAIIAGALAFHATMVTRANGVWASVHAFVADGEGTLSEDPYLRVLEIADWSPVGIEVTSYLIVMVAMFCFAILHLLREQKAAVSSAGGKTMLEETPAMSRLLILLFLIIALWIGSSAILSVGLALMLLIVNGDSQRPAMHWITLGVVMMLFSSWLWISDIQQSVVGMLPFLAPWLLSPENEGEFESLRLPFSDASARTRAARMVPWYGGTAFLLLTWLLLTVEIDGPSLKAHEFYGAPLLGLLALGLALYGWGRSLPADKTSSVMGIALVASIVLAIFSERLPFPGDPELVVTSGITRGAVGAFVLTWLLISLPTTAKQAWLTARRVVPHLRTGGMGGSNAARARLLGSHLAHLGILLLLVGHILTTTMLDRSDPSHLVTLQRDEAVEYEGYEMVFVGTEMLASEHEDYDFTVGDGFVGVSIEVWQDGELIDTMRPGMLRFDSPSGAVNARSEVDRMSRLSGDTIFILDLAQSNDLLSSMILGGLDDVETIRVTIYDLQGSHLVWLGWILIMLGGIAALSSGREGASEEE
tara:strand:- start:77 stop:2425 length:2349 start_codon:yes stop_codon:yes gene_type:complete